jgi:hypothetical protein
MNKWISATCDRFGHLITVETKSAATGRLFEALRAEQIESAPPIAPSAESAVKQAVARANDPNSRAKVAYPKNPHSDRR